MSLGQDIPGSLFTGPSDGQEDRASWQARMEFWAKDREHRARDLAIKAKKLAPHFDAVSLLGVFQFAAEVDADACCTIRALAMATDRDLAGASLTPRMVEAYLPAFQALLENTNRLGTLAEAHLNIWLGEENGHA